MAATPSSNSLPPFLLCMPTPAFTVNPPCSYKQGQGVQVRSSWAFVFVLMGVASWIVWQSAESCKMATLSYVGLLLATWLAWPPLIPQGGASSGFALDTAGTACPLAQHPAACTCLPVLVKMVTETPFLQCWPC